MKIIYKIGDLLQAPEKILLHGCNAQGVGNAGIFKLIRKKYSKAYQDYISVGDLHLGQIIISDCGTHIIINAITQEFYGRDKNVVYVSYDAIRTVVKQLNNMYIASIAFPLIGCGLANGDWKIVAQIIEEESTNFQPVVYLLSKDGAEREGIDVS